MNQAEDPEAWIQEPPPPTEPKRPIKARDMWKLLDG